MSRRQCFSRVHDKSASQTQAQCACIKQWIVPKPNFCQPPFYGLLDQYKETVPNTREKEERWRNAEQRNSMYEKCLKINMDFTAFLVYFFVKERKTKWWENTRREGKRKELYFQVWYNELEGNQGTERNTSKENFDATLRVTTDNILVMLSTQFLLFCEERKETILHRSFLSASLLFLPNPMWLLTPIMGRVSFLYLPFIPPLSPYQTTLPFPYFYFQYSRFTSILIFNNRDI